MEATLRNGVVAIELDLVGNVCVLVFAFVFLWFGIEFTQAELIALGFIVLGLIGLIFSMRRRRTITPALG